MSYAVPHLALIPIIILWAGVGMEFRVILVVISTVFHVAVNVMAGVRTTEPTFIDVAKIYRASRVRLFRTVVLPASVPYIMTGLRQGASRALVAVVVAEFIAANTGIGYMISTSGVTLNTGRLMFGIVILGVLGIIVGELLHRLESRFERWRT